MTMGSAEIHSLFPTPIYVIDGFMLSEEKQNRLIQEALSDSQQNLCGNLVSSNRYVLDLDYLSDLKDYLQLHLNKYAYEVYNITPTVQFYITQSWINYTKKTQKHYQHNCNGCWVNFHRKYDIVLHRMFEKYFGKAITGKMFGKYQWEADKKKTYKQYMEEMEGKYA